MGGTATGGTATGGTSTGGTGTGGTSMGGDTGLGGNTAMGGMGGEGPGPMGCDGDCTGVFGGGEQFDGFLIEDNPISVQGSDGIQGAGTSGQTCVPTADREDNGLLFKESHFQLTGDAIEPGVMYDVTVHITGVVECKVYPGGACTPPANVGRDGVYNMWCPGAQDNGDVWNTFMISVTDESSSTTPGMGPQDNGPLPDAAHRYMINQCPAGETVSHKTWQIDYDATFTVEGGQWINYVEFDTNCRQITNCGPSNDSGTECPSQYVLSVPPSVPAAPAALANATSGFAGGGGGFGQWMYFDVKSVVPQQ
jgi:hypothetical protein